MTEFLQGLICGGVASFFGCFIAGGRIHRKQRDDIEYLKDGRDRSRNALAKTIESSSRKDSEIIRLETTNAHLNDDVQRLLTDGLSWKAESEKLKQIIVRAAEVVQEGL
jgi:hypothetical protein